MFVSHVAVRVSLSLFPVYTCVSGNFMQDDAEDLSFKKSDVMEVLRKDEDDWWFAKHSDGRTGSIPVPYVIVVSKLYKCRIKGGVP